MNDALRTGLPKTHLDIFARPSPARNPRRVQGATTAHDALTAGPIPGVRVHLERLLR